MPSYYKAADWSNFIYKSTFFIYVPFACKFFNSAKLAPLQEYQNVNTITFGSTFIDNFQLINNYQENISINQNQNNKDLNSITNSLHQEGLQGGLRYLEPLENFHFTFLTRFFRTNRPSG